MGGTAPLGAVSLTSINDMTLPSITATTILAQTTGASADLTLGSGTILTASDPTGTAVTLAAGLGFINKSGPGAIVLTGAEDPPSWLIYSANPADNVFGGLNSDNTAVWNTPFGGTVTATGDRYVFVFQPAITVTAGNLIKIYGQDVTALVAADYTIGGVQPGVAGAYLGDTASAVYSGAPSVTSLGSPARAPVTGSPYSITVGLGSLVIDDGYGFVANSTGTLTVDPLALTYAVANASSTYGTTATLGAATLTGVLPGDTVDPTVGAFSGATPVALGPRTAAGLYSEEVTGLSNPNYSIASSGNTPGTLTISPLGLTYSVANASSTYGTTATLGAAKLTGVLPGDTVDPTSRVFRRDAGRLVQRRRALLPGGDGAFQPIRDQRPATAGPVRRVSWGQRERVRQRNAACLFARVSRRAPVSDARIRSRSPRARSPCRTIKRSLSNPPACLR